MDYYDSIKFFVLLLSWLEVSATSTTFPPRFIKTSGMTRVTPPTRITTLLPSSSQRTTGTLPPKPSTDIKGTSTPNIFGTKVVSSSNETSPNEPSGAISPFIGLAALALLVPITIAVGLLLIKRRRKRAAETKAGPEGGPYIPPNLETQWAKSKEHDNDCHYENVRNVPNFASFNVYQTPQADLKDTQQGFPNHATYMNSKEKPKGQISDEIYMTNDEDNISQAGYMISTVATPSEYELSPNDGVYQNQAVDEFKELNKYELQRKDSVYQNEVVDELKELNRYKSFKV